MRQPLFLRPFLYRRPPFLSPNSEQIVENFPHSKTGDRTLKKFLLRLHEIFINTRYTGHSEKHRANTPVALPHEGR